jgi:hypothetical protein
MCSQTYSHCRINQPTRTAESIPTCVSGRLVADKLSDQLRVAFHQYNSCVLYYYSLVHESNIELVVGVDKCSHT